MTPAAPLAASPACPLPCRFQTEPAKLQKLIFKKGNLAPSHSLEVPLVLFSKEP